MKEDKKKERGEVSRRDFLVGAGAAVVGGAIGAGITYPLLKGGGDVVTTTKVSTVPTTVTTTTTSISVAGEGEVVTITEGGTVTVTEPGGGEGIEPWQEPEETFIRDLGLGGGTGGSPARVDVKNGKVVRIRPLHLDEQYTKEHINPWSWEVRGKVIEAPMKVAYQEGLQMGYKKRIYSPNRIKYPLKRVDWDPNGERNPQNRGISKFERITWDEAADLVASEIKRIQAKYGKYAVYLQGEYHGEVKTVHSSHSCNMLLMKDLGYTSQTRNPDSWEGWFGGTKHFWGEGSRGCMYPTTNCDKDIMENCEMFIFFGDDPETTGDVGKGKQLFDASDVGIKLIWVTPDLNYAAAVHADKWIPCLPNCDAALELAIAHVWLTEDIYDKEYIETHTFGFDKFSDYVLGNEDGIPKSPQWASPLTGVPVWTIKALARQYASKITSYTSGGGKIRGPYSTESARLEAYLIAMQGLGKTGRHAHVQPGGGAGQTTRVTSGSAGRAVRRYKIVQPQVIAKLKIQQAILEGGFDNPISWYGAPDSAMPVEDQFKKYTYPIPEEEGGTEIHMMWTDCPCYLGNWTGGFRYIEAIRSPKIECIVTQHPWMEHETVFSDIILPVNTGFEEDDINAGSGCLTLERKAIEPIGESKSDYDGLFGIADKLGIYGEFTGGKTIEEWIKFGWEKSGVADMVTWEELQEKDYFVVPYATEWGDGPVGMQEFYENPDGNPLHTKSGKLEFYAQWLAENFPDDKERPPVAKWIIGGPKEEGWTHDESPFGEKAKTYPLPLVSNHARWRYHVQCDDNTWLREIPTCKIKGYDGYLYEPVWIHPTDAAKRGIKHGDIVKMYNNRGIVLGGAYITERIIPGSAYQDHGARTDLIADGIDRGGNNNIISPEETTSKNYTGMASNNFLVEVEKLDPNQMEEWRTDYPEAFSKEYDPASGLVFNNWVSVKAPKEPTPPPTTTPTGGGPATTEPAVTYGPTPTVEPTGGELVIWDMVLIYGYKMEETATGVSVTGSLRGQPGVEDEYIMLKVNFLDESGDVLYSTTEQKIRYGAHEAAVFEFKYDTTEPAKVKSFNFVLWQTTI